MLAAAPPPRPPARRTAPPSEERPDNRFRGAEGLRTGLRPARLRAALLPAPSAQDAAAAAEARAAAAARPGRGRGARRALLHDAFACHTERLSALLNEEWAFELALAEARLRDWPLDRLQRDGLVLLALCAAREPDLGASAVIRLQPAGWRDESVRDDAGGSPLLPFTALGPGDCVQLTQVGGDAGASPGQAGQLGADSLAGVVLERTPAWLKVALPEASAAGLVLGAPVWRLDASANAVSHERMLAAVTAFGTPGGVREVDAAFSPLQRALLGDAEAAAQPPPWRSGPRGGALARDAAVAAADACAAGGLNPSQRAAVAAALARTLTLLQGPPGTGKTATAVAFIVAALRSHPPGGLGGPVVLACAPSNVAADSLAAALLAALPAAEAARGVVRCAAPARSAPALVACTLAARCAEHPDGIRAAALRSQARGSSGAGEAAALRHAAREADANAAAAVLRSARVVVCTATAAGDPAGAGMLSYPWALLDEAAQATEPAALVALVRASAAVLVGDPAQLPPTVLSPAAAAGGLATSLPERLAKGVTGTSSGLPMLLLDTQYRMHPAISAFPAARFYGSRLRDGVAAVERGPAPPGFAWPNPSRPVAFVDVAAGREARDGDGGSLANAGEVAAVVRVLDGLLKAGSKSISVITFYAAQARELAAACPPGVEVRTVDGFQGRESEVVLLSCVRANERGAIGFAADARRVCVAITRARRGLIVLGDRATLGADPLWRAWLQWADKVGSVA